MIKLDIINEVVNRTGITKTKAEMAVDGMADRLAALEKEDAVEKVLADMKARAR